MVRWAEPASKAQMSDLEKVAYVNWVAMRATLAKTSDCACFGTLAMHRDRVQSPLCELECSVFASRLPPVPRRTGSASASVGHFGTKTVPFSSVTPRLKP